MSRAFSTTSNYLKKLKWTLNGTTEPVDWAIRNVEAAIDKTPGLKNVDTGVVNGNPHPTPSNNDPEHVSGAVGFEDMQGRKRITSFHAYKSGLVKFSKKIFGQVVVSTDESESSQA
ncbi:hypothetical protein Aspvir_009295 [Aspergillus viridinutans]|uniref:Uncharacterized protein n=1 Tax=Aspergillus viridinutans TaxID=75553 RepID=A0A9P3C3M9_ASPVI|nr:uncharacterized protein Aspvir_009295 [Aspergillus viridinutans]GIK05192.1 hypothetical protein Aspvir_009295 [Aspergillus viridinutans]